MTSVPEAMERHQIALYLAAIVAGFVVALLVPGASLLEVAINPAIALLLFVTFLGIPLTRLVHGDVLGDVLGDDHDLDEETP